MRAKPLPIERLPEAPRDADLLLAVPGEGRPVLFLDFDGTLSPIVDRPGEARPVRGVRETLRRLAERAHVAVVSGRDLRDVRDRLGVDGLAYAGSHGLDILLPDGRRVVRGEAWLEALARAERRLRAAIEGPDAIAGAEVERKRFSVAVHHRRVEAAKVPEVDRRVEEAAREEPGLRLERGKRVLELRPALDWDKGRAVLHLLDVFRGREASDGPSGPVLYAGDDVTDEDAFRALGDRALGLVVQGEDDGRLSHADLRVAGPEALARLLEAVADRLEAAARTADGPEKRAHPADGPEVDAPQTDPEVDAPQPDPEPSRSEADR